MSRGAGLRVVPTLDTGFSRSLLVDPGTGERLNDPGVIVGDRVTTNVSVTNTVTDTSLYSRFITPNLLETERTLMLVAQCLITDTAATLANRTATIRLKYGATTIATGTLRTASTDGATVVSIGTSIGYVLTALLSADGTSGTQVGHLTIAGPMFLGNPILGGILVGAFGTTTTARGAGTVDSTLQKLLDLSVQWSEASTLLIFTIESARLVLL